MCVTELGLREFPEKYSSCYDNQHNNKYSSNDSAHNGTDVILTTCTRTRGVKKGEGDGEKSDYDEWL